MSPTKIAAVVFLIVVLVVLGSQVRFFWQKNKEGEARYRELQAEMAQAKTSYDKAKADLNYYLNPDNLEKELRARFNYRSLGEKMLIIVPQTSSTNQ